MGEVTQGGTIRPHEKQVPVTFFTGTRVNNPTFAVHLFGELSDLYFMG